MEKGYLFKSFMIGIIIIFYNCKNVEPIYCSSEFTNKVKFDSLWKAPVQVYYINDSLNYDRVLRYAQKLCLPTNIDQMAVSSIGEQSFKASYVSFLLKDKGYTSYLTMLINSPRKLSTEIELEKSECSYLIVYSYDNSKYYRINGFEYTEIDNLLNELGGNVDLLTIMFESCVEDLNYVYGITNNIRKFKKKHCRCDVKREFEQGELW